MASSAEDGRVRAQYERWSYPAPVDDVAAHVAAGHRQLSDPAHEYHRYWPDRPRRPLSILVAGCGTHQAAVLAYCNRDSQVFGIDVSAASLAHSAALGQRAGLDNLRLRRLSLLDAAALGESFDLVICTGVLHHLTDPLAGLRSLGRVLARDGVMVVMLYGATLRTGVYMLQRAFRAAGVEQTPEGVATVRAALGALPAHHAARAYLAAAKELTSDAALVDTFLHPVDHAYDVAGVMALARDSGLAFGGWLDPRPYVPEAVLDPALCARLGVDRLDDTARAIIAEAMTQLLGKHVFLLVHQAAARPAPSFEGEAWLSWVPMPRLDLRVGRDAAGTPMIVRAGLAHVAGPAKAMLAAAADGRRTVLECILHATLADAGAAGATVVEARDAFRELVRDGHLLMLTGEAAAAARAGG